MFHNKIYKCILTVIAVCITMTGFSQVPLQRIYHYDSCGNRKLRKVPSSPAVTLRNLTQPVEEASNMNICIKESSCSYSCKVYPNPTTGQIYLDVEDLKTPFQGSGILYNANGVFLRSYKISESHTVFDLSDFPPGMYILKLTINKKSEEWKIIRR